MGRICDNLSSLFCKYLHTAAFHTQSATHTFILIKGNDVIGEWPHCIRIQKFLSTEQITAVITAVADSIWIAGVHKSCLIRLPDDLLCAFCIDSLR